MWFKGTKYGVGIWFILWGKAAIGYNAELYIRNWLLNIADDVPIVRIGRAVLTQTGWEEKEHWDSREQFLSLKQSNPNGFIAVSQTK